jgi:putative transposase
VKVRWSRALPSDPSSVTVTLDAAGRYHASFVVERSTEPLSPVAREIGVDLGLNHFATVATDDTHVADARRDWLHKLSTRLARENQAVYVEDLAVAGLARTRLAKSVHDAGWSTFVAMLEYKAAGHGRVFARIGRFEPTSQRCSACGVVDCPKPLGVRTWTCAARGVTHDPGRECRAQYLGRRTGGDSPWSRRKTTLGGERQ